MEELVLKVDDLEHQAYGSNLHLVSLSEGEEYSNMCAFLKKWILEVLGQQLDAIGPGTYIHWEGTPNRQNEHNQGSTQSMTHSGGIETPKLCRQSWIVKAARNAAQIL